MCRDSKAVIAEYSSLVEEIYCFRIYTVNQELCTNVLQVIITRGLSAGRDENLVSANTSENIRIDPILNNE